MGEDKEVDSHSCLNYWSGLSTNIVSGTHQESLEQNAHKIIDAIAHKKPASSDDSVLSRSSAEIPLISMNDAGSGGSQSAALLFFMSLWTYRLNLQKLILIRQILFLTSQTLSFLAFFLHPCLFPPVGFLPPDETSWLARIIDHRGRWHIG